MTDVRPAAAPPRSRSWTTLWYYVVVVVSLGLLSGVPFAHAATRLRRGSAAVWCAVSAVLYTAVIITAFVISGTRTDPADSTGGLIAIIVMAVAVVHLTFVRRQVARSEPPRDPGTVDPAVEAVLESRRARERARRIVETDPAMARDLRIGRPDLTRTFDDGGLADLNSAPASVIAWACGVQLPVAEKLVAARAAAGGPFLRVDDAFTYSDVPVDLWDRIRDRSVVVP